jgi:hypothetical protein|tara:strand:- start:692 stop:1651 length:960 start_codon:yes stop_codon:yes gene_type:complete
MASPNSTFTEIVSTTLRNHPNAVADNVSEHNALWRRLSEKGNIRVVNGGYEIVEPLDYAENSTYQRYSGFEQLNVGASDVISAAKYDWKQAAVHVVSSGLELRQNSGKEAMISLAKSKLKNAMRTFANNLSSDIYSDGTGSGGKQMGGLEHLVTQAGTGTVGGIVSGTFTFWKNQFKDGSGADKTTIGDKMRELWLLTQRQGDVTDFIVSSTDLYTLYWNGLTDLQRYTSRDDVAGDGFASGLKFNTADIFHDTSDSGASTTSMYFLNTEYLKIVAHKDANLSQLDEKTPINQDGVAIPIIFQGNVCCSNRARQGVLFD